MEKTAICTRENYNRRVVSAKSKKRNSRVQSAVRSCDILRRIFLVFTIKESYFFTSAAFFFLEKTLVLNYKGKECIHILLNKICHYKKYPV